MLLMRMKTIFMTPTMMATIIMMVMTKTRWQLIVSPPRVVAPVVRVAPQLNRYFFIFVYI